MPGLCPVVPRLPAPDRASHSFRSMAKLQNEAPSHPAAALARVVEGGYCIGCGICSHVLGGEARMKWTPDGMLRPELPPIGQASESVWKIAEESCPFSDAGPNETEIGERLYPGTAENPNLGRYRGLLAGHATDPAIRARGSSGGIITWMLIHLLESGEVDYVVNVRPKEDGDGVLFHYDFCTTREQLLASGKSKYYPIELSAVLARIRERPGRCAVVALPCFLKGIRKLADQDVALGSRIRFCIGLICGHLKSKAFAECLAAQVGAGEQALLGADFRVKYPDGGASRYGFMARTEAGVFEKRMRGLLGANWGHNLFRYPACDHCDDVFAECADLAVGDAWLPGYISDSSGNSIVVVRHERIASLLEAARSRGEVRLDEISPEQAAASQAGGLRDRREGLRYRQYLKQQEGLWAPTKRFPPGAAHLGRRRKKIYRSRMRLGAASHVLWRRAGQKGGLEHFKTEIAPMVSQLDALYQPWEKRAYWKLRSFLKKLFSKS